MKLRESEKAIAEYVGKARFAGSQENNRFPQSYREVSWLLVLLLLIIEL
jgi:hypothetical protein